MGTTMKDCLAVAAVAALATAGLAAAAGVVTLHPGQSRKIGKISVVCTTKTLARSATRIVVHPGHQAHVAKTTVKCVAAAKPKPAPAPTPTPTPIPPAPTPPAPAPVALTAGDYKGATQDGNYVYLTITPLRTMTMWRTNDLTEQCNDGYYIPGAISLDKTSFPIADDGSFHYVADGTYTYNGTPASYHFDVTGTISGTSISGTVVLADTLDADGHHLTCASPVTKWTATLQ